MAKKKNPRRTHNLPIADRNAELQQHSINAITNCLPPERFVFRLEDKIDAGVDGTIELKIEGDHKTCHSHYTNMVARIQVKSQEEGDYKKDGSVALDLEPSNLEYLLNGPCPLYVLYVVATEDLRYVWAREEKNRIEKTRPKWRQGRSITLRFRAKLNRQSLDRLYERVREESILTMKTHDVLSRGSITEKTSVTIDRQALTVSNPIEIRNLLVAGGMSMVSAGYAPEVLQIAEQLNHTDKQLPRILLIRAYAEYVRSHYLAASGLIAEATLRLSELQVSDRHFMEFLGVACDWHCGIISLDEYLEKQKLNWNEGGAFSLSRQIDYLVHKCYAEPDMIQRQENLARLRAKVAEALALEDASETLKLQARINLIHCEGADWVFEFNRRIADIQLRIDLNNIKSPDDMHIDKNGSTEGWIAKANQAVEDARKAGNFRLLGDAMLTRAAILFAQFSFGIAVVGHDKFKDSINLISREIMPTIRSTIECYHHADYIEGELKAKVQLADYADLVGDHEQAKSLGSEVLPIAKAFKFHHLAENAEQHIQGVPFHRKMAASIFGEKHEDQDISMSQKTDAQMKENARGIIEANGLPMKRLPLIERECISWQDIAVEKMQWCRHIELVQSERHQKDMATFFATDPARYCRCEKLGHESLIGNPDWKAVITAFKVTYCQGCPDREPKSNTL